jgi:hypothetical protein
MTSQPPVCPFNSALTTARILSSWSFPPAHLKAHCPLEHTQQHWYLQWDLQPNPISSCLLLILSLWLDAGIAVTHCNRAIELGPSTVCKLKEQPPGLYR